MIPGVCSKQSRDFLPLPHPFDHGHFGRIAGVQFAKTESKYATADEGYESSNGKEGDWNRLAGMFAKDWVEDFEEPDKAMVDEGRKAIDFLLKRY